jgi:hypothetical protein
VSDARLVGEWIGTWTSTLFQGTGPPAGPTPRGIRNNGDYLLTISRVEGKTVYGRVQQPGLPVPEFNFVGKLDNDMLSYSSERIQTELKITGDRMAGTRLGGQMPWQISLQKKK